MIYEKSPDRGLSHINRYWLVFAPTFWPVFKPTLTPDMQLARNRAAITAIAVLIAAVFEWVIRGLPAGRRKLFSGPRPRHPKGPSLILSPECQDLAGAARLLCNFPACGPVPGSTLGSVEVQVFTFEISSQRVV